MPSPGASTRFGGEATPPGTSPPFDTELRLLALDSAQMGTWLWDLESQTSSGTSRAAFCLASLKEAPEPPLKIFSHCSILTTGRQHAKRSAMRLKNTAITT